jgi:hypothetical protein
MDQGALHPQKKGLWDPKKGFCWNPHLPQKHNNISMLFSYVALTLRRVVNGRGGPHNGGSKRAFWGCFWTRAGSMFWSTWWSLLSGGSEAFERGFFAPSRCPIHSIDGYGEPSLRATSATTATIDVAEVNFRTCSTPSQPVDQRCRECRPHWHGHGEGAFRDALRSGDGETERGWLSPGKDGRT